MGISYLFVLSLYFQGHFFERSSKKKKDLKKRKRKKRKRTVINQEIMLSDWKDIRRMQASGLYFWDSCDGKTRIWNPSRKAFVRHSCGLGAGQTVDTCFCEVGSHLTCILRFISHRKLSEEMLKSSSACRKEEDSGQCAWCLCRCVYLVHLHDGITGTNSLDLPQPELQLNSFACLLQLKIMLPKSAWLDKQVNSETQLYIISPRRASYCSSRKMLLLQRIQAGRGVGAVHVSWWTSVFME